MSEPSSCTACGEPFAGGDFFEVTDLMRDRAGNLIQFREVLCPVCYHGRSALQDLEDGR